MAGEATLRVKINGHEITLDGPIVYVDVLHDVGNAGTAYHFDTGLEARILYYDDTEEVGDSKVDLVHQWEVNAK